MSHTRRNITLDMTHCGFRNPRHRPTIVMEIAAMEELREFGGNISHNRLRNFRDRIVTNYDDLKISGLNENYDPDHTHRSTVGL